MKVELWDAGGKHLVFCILVSNLLMQKHKALSHMVIVWLGIGKKNLETYF